MAWCAGMETLDTSAPLSRKQTSLTATVPNSLAEAVFSMGAQVLLAYRWIENWVLWVAIDVVSIGLYIYRDLEPTAGLYGGFLAMSLVGLREWIMAQRADRLAIEARPA